MYLRILLLVYAVDAINILVWVTFTISLILSIFFLIMHLCGVWGAHLEDKTDEYWKHKKWNKLIKKLVIVAIITLLLGTITYKPKRIIGIVIANQVDNYIKENEESIYNPQEILNTIDAGIEKIKKLIEEKE